MKPVRMFSLLTVLIFAVTALGQGTKRTVTGAPQAQQPTIAAIVDREISNVEKQLLDVAEAMPEEKYNFTPESLNIAGDDYKGVRTFAGQVKHVAASNYFIWSPLTGDKMPEGLKDGNGPQSIKTKAEIISFLKDSFALGSQGGGYLAY